MNLKHLVQWRQTLAHARQSPQCAQELRWWIQETLPRLHRTIHLPSQAQVEALEVFLVRYVEQVPAQLEAMERALLRAEAEVNMDYFLHIACDFFTHQPQHIVREGGWQALLAEAYLAHRIVEELYDHAALQGYFPAINTQALQADVIVHHVLGEEFANQLDMGVFYALETLLPAHTPKPTHELAAVDEAPAALH